MTDEVHKYLTPDQLDKLRDGWHSVIVVGVGDYDSLHAALTLDYHDAGTESLWADIKKQMRQRHFLDRVGLMIGETDAATAPPDGGEPT